MSTNPYANICAECGEDREDHHDFVPYEIPDGCMCDTRDWGAPKISPICSSYVENKRFPGQCDNSEHLKECHK